MLQRSSISSSWVWIGKWPAWVAIGIACHSGYQECHQVQKNIGPPHHNPMLEPIRASDSMVMIIWCLIMRSCQNRLKSINDKTFKTSSWKVQGTVRRSHDGYHLIRWCIHQLVQEAVQGRLNHIYYTYVCSTWCFRIPKALSMLCRCWIY